MSEYSDELERAKAKQLAKWRELQVTGRARRLLGLAGWSATEEQLRKAAAEMSKVDQYTDEDLERVISRALEIQNDESHRGRRLRPKEIEQMAKATVDAPTREKIRAHILERRRADPKLTAPPVHAEVQKKFDVTISIDNFYVSYWSKVSKQLKSNGNGETEKPAPAAKQEATPAAKQEATPAAQQATEAPKHEAAAPPATVEVAKSTAPTKPPSAVGGPYLSFLPLSNGQTRVSLEVMVDAAGAAVLMQTIGQGLSIINRTAR